MDFKRKTEGEQVDFFDACLAKYQEAAEKMQQHRFYYQIGESRICLVFAGEALIPHMTPALAHLLEDSSEEAELEIMLWDSESAGVEMAPPPCEWGCFTDRGDIWGFDSKRIKTAFHWGEFSVNVMDLDRRLAVYWVQTEKTMPYWTASAPLRTMIHWWMEHKGMQLLHAAALGTDHAAFVLTGKGGIGKSTTALSCLNAGMLYAGDDYLIVGQDPDPRVYSLYSTAKVKVEELKNFPSLMELAAPLRVPDQEKAILFLYPKRKDQIKRSMPLKYLLTPRFGKTEGSFIKPIPNWAIVRNMSFTTMSQLPCVGEHTNEFIQRLCNRLPVYELELGKDIPAVPNALNDLLTHPEGYPGTCMPDVDDKAVPWPLISVVMPVYNGAEFVEDAVNNILSQEYPALEIILVNDGSTDNSEEVIRSLSVDIRYFYQENDGPASARNKGIKDATAEFIAFLDVDDLWPPKNLFLMMRELMANPELLVVHGQAQLMEKNEESGLYEYSGNPREAFQGYIGAGLYRKEAFNVVGLYDSFMKCGEDADWFQRAHELNISFKKLDEVTLFVRRHGKNMTEGMNLVELNALKVFKKSLDRMRQPDLKAKITSAAAETTVIVPVYNGESYLKEAIKSIFSQGLDFKEILVIDDGSQDRSAEIAREYAPVVRLIQQENKGAAAARNLGITQAEGKFLAFLDADDLWVKGMMHLLLRALQDDQALDMVFGHVEQFISPELKDDSHKPLRHDLKKMPGFLMGAMLARKEVFEIVGLLPEHLQLAEFIDWFQRATEQGMKYLMLDETVMRRRIHTSNQGLTKQDHLKDYTAVAHAALKRLRESGHQEQ